MSVSVAMAAYNGSKYIESQLYSILNQLNANDEVIVSCDKGTDNTFSIVEEIARRDSRVKVVLGPSKGVIANFENAISKCTKDYIFLSDQDDVWMNTKVSDVLLEFNKTNAGLVIHDALIVDEKLKEKSPSFFNMRGSRSGILNNIIKNSYIGCCMAFKKELKEIILPFPKGIPMHDQWIGLAAEKYSSVSFLDKPLIKYRRHSDNVSSDTHADPFTMLRWRMSIIKAILSRRNYD